MTALAPEALGVGGTLLLGAVGGLWRAYGKQGRALTKAQAALGAAEAKADGLRDELSDLRAQQLQHALSLQEETIKTTNAMANAVERLGTSVDRIATRLDDLFARSRG